MFTFFTGSIDDLLNKVSHAKDSEVKRIKDENTVLNREEIVATIMDEWKVDKEEATRIADDIQLSELHRVCGDLVKDGILEITGFDEYGPTYTHTAKGLAILEALKKKDESKINPISNPELN